MPKRERMKDPISVRKQESIANEMASLHERIMRRAMKSSKTGEASRVSISITHPLPEEKSGIWGTDFELRFEFGVCPTLSLRATLSA
jgi:hypothetical protein